MIIARYDAILDQSECTHLHNHLSNILNISLASLLVWFTTQQVCVKMQFITNYVHIITISSVFIDIFISCRIPVHNLIFVLEPKSNFLFCTFYRVTAMNNIPGESKEITTATIKRKIVIFHWKTNSWLPDKNKIDN